MISAAWKQTFDLELLSTDPHLLTADLKSVTPASSSHHLPVTPHTGGNWLNAEIVKSRKGVRCRPARSSTDVCQRGAVHQRIGRDNTPCGVSPNPQGAWLALRLVRQGDGIHYPVGQPLLGDSLPFLLTSVADKKLLRGSKAPEVSAVRSAVLADRNLSSTESSGSKGHLWSPARMIERSQEGTRGGLGGFNLLEPLRNLTMRLCFPRDQPSTASRCAVIAATYTFKVEGDSLHSNPSCRKESTTPIVHLRGSSLREEHQTANRLHSKARACLLERALAWLIVTSTIGGRTLKPNLYFCVEPTP